MGLQKNEGGNYITILAGKFSQRVPEGTEGAVTRVNKNDKTVHEMYYESFVGKLVGIKTQNGDYGKNWVFEFQDSDSIYLLQLSYANSYAIAFLKMLPNIDVSKEMKVSPQQKIEGDKTKTALFVNQDGNAIKHFYTKDDPKGIPQWEQITVNGQLQWDSTKQVNFLEEMVNKDIVPKLPEKQVPDNQKDILASTPTEEVEVPGEKAPSLDDEF